MIKKRKKLFKKKLYLCKIEFDNINIMDKQRLYFDISVFGDAFDEEFKEII